MSTVTTEIEDGLKNQAEEILNQLGLSLSKAFNLFIRQIIIHRAFPELKAANKFPVPCIDDITKEEIEVAVQKAFDVIESGLYELVDEAEQILGIDSNNSVMNVQFSSLAFDDVKYIHAYTECKTNSKNADELRNRFMWAAETLAIFPEMHYPRMKDKMNREIRFFPVDDYLMLYSIDENEKVNILRIFYAKRNAEAWG